MTTLSDGRVIVVTTIFCSTTSSAASQGNIQSHHADQDILNDHEYRKQGVETQVNKQRESTVKNSLSFKNHHPTYKPR